jgi:hypothetical protein
MPIAATPTGESLGTASLLASSEDSAYFWNDKEIVHLDLRSGRLTKKLPHSLGRALVNSIAWHEEVLVVAAQRSSGGSPDWVVWFAIAPDGWRYKPQKTPKGEDSEVYAQSAYWDSRKKHFVLATTYVNMGENKRVQLTLWKPGKKPKTRKVVKLDVLVDALCEVGGTLHGIDSGTTYRIQDKGKRWSFTKVGGDYEKPWACPGNASRLEPAAAILTPTGSQAQPRPPAILVKPDATMTDAATVRRSGRLLPVVRWPAADGPRDAYGGPAPEAGLVQAIDGGFITARHVAPAAEGVVEVLRFDPKGKFTARAAMSGMASRMLKFIAGPHLVVMEAADHLVVVPDDLSAFVRLDKKTLAPPP